MNPKKRVLIVDDEQGQITVVRARLAAEGFDVTTALDGEQGLRLVSENPPDAVIVDLMVPKVDGIEFCRRVKQDSKLREIPVILFTASVSGDLNDLCQAYGFAAYLKKPYETKELVELLKSLTHVP